MHSNHIVAGSDCRQHFTARERTVSITFYRRVVSVIRSFLCTA